MAVSSRRSAAGTTGRADHALFRTLTTFFALAVSQAAVPRDDSCSRVRPDPAAWLQWQFTALRKPAARRDAMGSDPQQAVSRAKNASSIRR